MAAASLPAPGTELGPCESQCEHIDCAQTYLMAHTLCEYCGEVIGFNRPFYRINNEKYRLAHAQCYESALDE